MTEILAKSVSADFYPHMNMADENREMFKGDTITWTFELPKAQAVGAGIYRIEFVRSLAEEEALGNPVLGA